MEELPVPVLLSMDMDKTQSSRAFTTLNSIARLQLTTNKNSWQFTPAPHAFAGALKVFKRKEQSRPMRYWMPGAGCNLFTSGGANTISPITTEVSTASNTEAAATSLATLAIG